MSLWLWLLVCLAALGALAVLVGSVAAVTAARRLQRRIAAVSASPLFDAPLELRISRARLERSFGEANELLGRARTAVQSLQETLRRVRALEIAATVIRVGSALRTLGFELR